MAQSKATCVKFAKTCLAAALALGAAATKAAVALAFALFAATTAVADEDLNGGTRSITTADGLKGKTWINGTLDVSANQTLADATTTLGSGLTVNQTSGWWGLAGTTTLNINGATVNYTSTSTGQSRCSHQLHDGEQLGDGGSERQEHHVRWHGTG